MNEKELSELRRRLRPDRCGITHIRGCCVNENREVIAQFDQSLALLGQDESERFLALLKRALSGTLGKHLVDISFTTQQVVDSDEHRLLMSLRDSRLKDEEAVQRFFQRAIEGLEVEGNYLILLAHDVYDVPYRSKDGEEQGDASADVYSYILCAVCPVKLTKPALSYRAAENEFYSRAVDWLVAPPETGFLFPAFDNRCANLYDSLLYTKDPGDAHEGFVQSVFQCQPPMPAQVQKETFQSVLGDALEEECSMEVVQAVREQLCDMLAEHKETPDAGPLVLSKGAVKCVLRSCGVSDSHVERFDGKYDGAFGADTALTTQNLVDPKHIQVCTPNVTIQVDPERSDLVEARVIDGKKYILIRADEGVEVNGIAVHID